MLNRKLLKYLIEWKDRDDKNCIFLYGARQVGKTFLINNDENGFKLNYKNYLMINFETNQNAKKFFEDSLEVDKIINKIKTEYQNLELEPYNTLLFFDEIQYCPIVRTSLKYFSIDKRYDVIASGSLLGIKKSIEHTSIPVGYEERIEMLPLDFEEFLWANGYKDEQINQLKNAFLNKKIDRFFGEVFNNLLNQYIVIGGMPAVVNEYIKNKDFSAAFKKQNYIIENYIEDIRKNIDGSLKERTLSTFLSIPKQLSKENKKFFYNEIDDNGAPKKAIFYWNAISWLMDARIINLSYNVEEPITPLDTKIKINDFKVFLNDISLLTSMMEKGTQQAILSKQKQFNAGGIIENLCSQIIYSNGYKKQFFYKKKSGLEIDFVQNVNGKCAAIEVKSSINNKSKSLETLMNNYKSVELFYNFSMFQNVVEKENNIWYLPMCLLYWLD